MATGGKYSRSIENGGEEYFDFACGPCGKDGRHIEAVKGCVECAQNFCNKCLKDHNTSKFAGLKSHKILDKAGILGSRLQFPALLSSDDCTIHPGKPVDMYCGTHDDIFCGACIAIDHRLCNGVDYVPNVAAGIRKSKEVEEVKKSIQQVQIELDQIRTASQGDLKRIGQEQATSLADIDDFRNKIVNHLDELVKIAKQEVQSQSKLVEDEINADIQIIKEMISTLKTNMTRLQAAEHGSEPELFLNVKRSKHFTTEGNKLAQTTEASMGNRNAIFNLADNITGYFLKLQAIGTITDQSQTANGIDVNVKLKSDRNTCDIHEACLMDDGSLIITDRNNNKIKKLDKSFNVVEECDVPSIPLGVCRTGSTEVAMTTVKNKDIWFVSTAIKLAVIRSFPVGENCHYVTFSDGELFVSCDKSVKVYTLSGDHLRTIKYDSTGRKINFNPRKMAVSKDGTKLHIESTGSDGSSDEVITVDKKGRMLSQFSDTALKSARGICFGGDEMFVPGMTNNNIIQLGDQGRTRSPSMLMSGKHGLNNPRGLFFYANNSRLIVNTRESNFIKVLTMFRK